MSAWGIPERVQLTIVWLGSILALAWLVFSFIADRPQKPLPSAAELRETHIHEEVSSCLRWAGQNEQERLVCLQYRERMEQAGNTQTE